ncbi:hypothetical protein Bbelb_292760 [Branchiostoma belcheri]|nr:hypothetical protein Bbelb_292760 [Branchiostoma belcheri]
MFTLLYDDAVPSAFYLRAPSLSMKSWSKLKLTPSTARTHARGPAFIFHNRTELGEDAHVASLSPLFSVACEILKHVNYIPYVRPAALLISTRPCATVSSRFFTSVVCSKEFAPSPHRLGRPDHLELGPHWLTPPDDGSSRRSHHEVSLEDSALPHLLLR